MLFMMCTWMNFKYLKNENSYDYKSDINSIIIVYNSKYLYGIRLKNLFIDDLIILYFIDQPVEGEKEAGATEHQGGEDQVVPVVRWMDVVDLGGSCSGDLLHPW